MGYVSACLCLILALGCGVLWKCSTYSCCKYMYAFTKYFCRFIYDLDVLTGIQGSRALFGTGIVNRTLRYLDFPVQQTARLITVLLLANNWQECTRREMHFGICSVNLDRSSDSINNRWWSRSGVDAELREKDPFLCFSTMACRAWSDGYATRESGYFN